MQKILVTGGAGFIGSHIVELFIAAGHEVVVIDNLHTGKRENLHPAARFYEADLRNLEQIKQIFAAERPTIISHQAALANVRQSFEDPVAYVATNVVGTLNLLEAARLYKTGKLIFASTGGAIYGDATQQPTTESYLPQPLDPYGISKLAAEHYILSSSHSYGLDYCILRYPNVYGPRQDPFGEGGVVAIFTNKMLNGEQTIINGDGLQQRDFVYVGDIARANLLAASQGRGIYNIASGIGTDINTIFRELASATDYALPETHGAGKAGEVRISILDASLAAKELGWQPTVNISEGLHKTVSYFAK
jgi:UDP-glucose 4-epimerase